MQLVILTPDQEVFAGEVISVKLPGKTGQFEILDNHAPMVAALGNGAIRVLTSGNQSTTYTISKGFVEVLKNKVSLLVQGLETT